MLIAIIAQIAAQYGVDPNLVQAIVQVESSGNALCMRFEPKKFSEWSQNTKVQLEAQSASKRLFITPQTEMVLRCSSLGPMQVLGQVAREQGFTENLMQLCDPEKGITQGVKKLVSQLRRYNQVTIDAIAAYNAGSVVKDLDGKYKNQEYVDKVLKELNTLKIKQ